jgi:hypothetical protein
VGCEGDRKKEIKEDLFVVDLLYFPRKNHRGRVPRTAVKGRGLMKNNNNSRGSTVYRVVASTVF